MTYAKALNRKCRSCSRDSVVSQAVEACPQCHAPYGPVRLGLDRFSRKDDPSVPVERVVKTQAVPIPEFDDADTRVGEFTNLFQR